MELGHPHDQIALIEPTTLRVIRNVVNQGNADEWLSRSESLPRSDLEKKG